MRRVQESEVCIATFRIAEHGAGYARHSIGSVSHSEKKSPGGAAPIRMFGFSFSRKEAERK